MPAEPRLRLSRLILDEHERMHEKARTMLPTPVSEGGLEWPDFVSVHDQLRNHNVLVAYGTPSRLLLPVETFDPHEFRAWLLTRTRGVDSAHYWNFHTDLPTARGPVRVTIHQSNVSYAKTEHATITTQGKDGKPEEIGRVKFPNRAWSEIELNTDHPLHGDLLKALVNFVRNPTTEKPKP